MKALSRGLALSLLGLALHAGTVQAQPAAASAASSGEALSLAADPVVEARLVGIAEDLRCLVCQNESLAGSRADLAEDLRREIRRLIREGKSDQQVIDFLVERYGDFVRYRPPFKPSTWLLWGGPFVFALGGVAGLLVFLKRRRALPEQALSEQEDRQLAALVADKESRE